MTRELLVGTPVKIGLNKYGEIVGPSHEAGKYVVAHYPGIGSEHYRGDELTVVDQLPPVDWNHIKLG